MRVRRGACMECRLSEEAHVWSVGLVRRGACMECRLGEERHINSDNLICICYFP